MPRYCVNATMSAVAWVYVDADTPEGAQEAADQLPPQVWEIDRGTGEIDFNIDPMVEVEDD